MKDTDATTGFNAGESYAGRETGHDRPFYVSMTGMIRALTCLAAMSMGLATAQAATQVPNTIPCKNFSHNADGSWTADPYTRAFDIGNLHNYRLESAIIFENEFTVGGVDLWLVIDSKCGVPQPNALSNSVGTFAN